MAKRKESAKGPAKKLPASARGAPAGESKLPTPTFPVVGIGASAGGLEAFTKLLHHLPANTGMAFVLIQHLDPKHESILASLLSRTTKMAVREATNRMRLERDHVYVIPPNTNMAMVDRTLVLTHRPDAGDRHMPIDHFFRSLAESQKDKAIGVILSGTASDGTAGLRAIKSEDGITFVQDPSSARYEGMPRNAISANVVDFILPPETIASELANVSRHPYVKSQSIERAADLLLEGKSDIGKIFSLLRTRTGADFSAYKKGTIARRVRRRMVLRKTEKLSDYVKLLKGNPEEVMGLYEDLLIHVTDFFRDPKTFDRLKRTALAKL